ncbi:hypothetical protein PVAP13_8KG389315 [Panicum virgatum]|uniref:Uncharacterized protein n=1 Tax=Panicum virgatum TaxID=38727 RepID=A0A8T0PUL6_PANVG|nr:hypothetical protein PVAP13_8KG389315 [Panicum virgatum]
MITRSWPIGSGSSCCLHPQCGSTPSTSTLLRDKRRTHLCRLGSGPAGTTIDTAIESWAQPNHGCISSRGAKELVVGRSCIRRH